MFTNKKNNDTIEVSNFNFLPEDNQKSINSAYKAMNSGIIPASVYIANAEKNGGIVKISSKDFSGANNIIASNETFNKSAITEDLEKKRIAKAANVKSFEDVSDDTAKKISKLTEKTPENYYDLTGNQAEDNKRLKEIFGAKTDFSISNVENNYEMLNSQEKAVLTKKTQDYLNDIGYADSQGLKLKPDGEFGPKTRGVYNNYKSNMGYKEPEVAKNKRVNNTYGTVALATNKVNNKISTSNYDGNHYTYSDISLVSKADKKSLLSSSSKELINQLRNKDVLKNNESYQNLLNKYVNDTKLRQDTTQYVIYKLLRAINNQKNSASKKNMAVVDFMLQAVKQITKDSIIPPSARQVLDKAFQFTNPKYIKEDCTKVVSNWADVFIKLTDIPKDKQLFRKKCVDDTQITADLIDNSINTIIDGFNLGYDGVKIYTNTPSRVKQEIYNTKTKELKLYFLTNDNGIGIEPQIRDDYSNIFKLQKINWF